MALRQIQPLVDMHIVMLQPDGISPALLSKLEDNRFLDMPLNKMVANTMCLTRPILVMK